MRLLGKVALITGAGSGIGRAIALRFGQEGARLGLADVDSRAAARITAEVGTGTALALRVDVAEAGQVDAAFASLATRFGRLDVLVNSAGVGGRGTVDATPTDVWRRCLAVNLTGVFNCCRAAVPLLREGGGGSIINIASVAGLRPVGGGHAYAASKGGVVMLTRAMAQTYARENIRVRAICPTAVDTPLLDPLFADQPDPLNARQRYGEREPSGRMIRPDEVAALAVYLASDDAFPFTPEPYVI